MVGFFSAIKILLLAKGYEDIEIDTWAYRFSLFSTIGFLMLSVLYYIIYENLRLEAEQGQIQLELSNLKTKKTEGHKLIDYLFVRVEYEMVKVEISDIIFIEGLKDYVKIHLTSSRRPVITKMSMKGLEEKLPNELFLRAHKSFIVSVNKIKVIRRDFVTVGEREIPIGENYKGNLKSLTC